MATTDIRSAPSAREPRRRGFGRWAVRLLAVLGCFLLVVGTAGWWLSSRVLDGNGFADVVAKASQKPEVRDYIGDQASLRLARTSPFVSGARPLVASAISAAIATPPVEEAIYEFARRAHQQIYRAQAGDRVDVDARQASTTIRSALETINPALAKKLPANVLDASTTVSQSREVDLLFTLSPWVDALSIPLMLAGLAVLAIACVKARDRVRAVRTIGIVMAGSGALLMGFGAAAPAFAFVAATTDPGRGSAVAAFVEVLLGRLVGGGRAIVLVGLLLALAPGRDGGDLAARVARVRAWFARRRESPRWRITGGIALFVLGALVLTVYSSVLQVVLFVGAVLLMYVGVVVVLRAGGIIAPGEVLEPLHKRQLVAVAAVMVFAFAGTAGVAVAVVAGTVKTPEADSGVNGCNGYVELCVQPLDQVVWAGSHNAMNSAAYDFYAAEHTITVPEQLNAGARLLMLDAYYGYDDDGIVRTNLAGGIDRKQLAQEEGEDAVKELDRVGGLTGTADLSGKKNDVYFCHNFCELGAIKAHTVLTDIRTFLERHLTDVIAIDVEDYIKPADLKKELQSAGLLDRVWIPKSGAKRFPTLGEMTKPPKGRTEQKRRLVVMTEKAKTEFPGQLPTYDWFEESPYDFQAISQFNCAPNRGGTGKDLLLVNHWLRPDGPPDPAEAARVNSSATLTRRLQQCIATRQHIPNVLAVDFTAIGDLYKTVDRFNAAIAKLTGVTAYETSQLDHSKHLSASQRAEIDAFHRLPRISRAKALALLGPGAALLKPPPVVADAAAVAAAQ